MRNLKKDKQNGSTFIEALVALVVLSTVAIAFLSGLATITKVSAMTDTKSTAESLAVSQVEYVKKCSYVINAAEYPLNPDIVVPAGWSVSSAAVEPLGSPDNGLQKFTVTIAYNGKTMLVMSGYKANR